MIRVDRFWGSVLFAAIAASVWFPFALVATPLLGGFGSRVAYLGLVALGYGVGLAPRPLLRLRVAAVTVVVAAALALLARTTGELAIGLAVLLAFVRSGLVEGARPARTIVLECLLGAGALVFARALAGPTALSFALSVWGFLLVQSFYYWTPRRARRRAESHGDPFEEAHRRAGILLEGHEV